MNSENPQTSICDEEDGALLHRAAEYNYAPLVTSMFELFGNDGLVVNIEREEDKRTPLHVAAREPGKREEVLDVLISLQVGPLATRGFRTPPVVQHVRSHYWPVCISSLRPWRHTSAGSARSACLRHEGQLGQHAPHGRDHERQGQDGREGARCLNF